LAILNAMLNVAAGADSSTCTTAAAFRHRLQTHAAWWSYWTAQTRDERQSGFSGTDPGMGMFATWMPDNAEAKAVAKRTKVRTPLM